MYIYLLTSGREFCWLAVGDGMRDDNQSVYTK